VYLKSLEISGFKSFVDPTRMEFPPGLSAIVGPNGCGKSNVVDAIRWVIGEHGTKALRGNRMEDLIFSGSETRKSLGMAEVSLTIANLPVSVSIANLQDLSPDEVTVTRRYFRSGESEYCINKTPCRMKDIIDLFLDTGISSRGFSIIEQDHVSQIINAKPINRRYLVEEAAGIMKYKNRKNEALRKLEYTSQNLIRINDVVSELYKQRQSLKRQAKKAEVYKRFKKEARELGLALHSFKYREQKENLDVLEEKLSKLKDRQEELSAQNATVQNKIESHKAEAEENDRQLNLLKQQNSDINGKIGNFETRVELMKKQIKEQEIADDKADEEIKQLNMDFENFEQLVKSESEKEKIVENEIALKEKIFQEKNNNLQELKKSLEVKTDNLEDLEADLVDIAHAFSNAKNNEASLKTRNEILEQNMQKLTREADESEKVFHELDAEVDKNKEALSKAKENAIRVKEEKDALVCCLEKDRNRFKERALKLAEAGKTYTEEMALLNSLNELYSNFEGFHEGVKSIMKFHEEPGGVQGIQDVLTNIIDIPPEYQVALESALGDKTQGIIMNSPDESLKAIQFLKDRASGRSTFFLLNPKLPIRKEFIMNGTQGVVGKLLALAKFPEKYKVVMEYLLGNVIVVENIDRALSLSKEIGDNYIVVTLGGDLIDPHGTITGGAPLNNGASLLTKKRKISELKDGTAKLKKDVDLLQEQQDEIEKTIISMEQGKDVLEQNAHETTLNFRVEEKKCQQLNDSFISSKEKMETYKFEKEQSEADRKELLLDLEQLRVKLEGLNSKKLQKEEEIINLRETIVSIRLETESLMQVVSGIEVEKASLQGKKENISSDVERWKSSRELTQTRVNQKKEEKLENENKKIERVTGIKDYENQINLLSEEKNIVEKKIIQYEEILEEKLKALKELEEKGKVSKLGLENIGEEVNSLEISRAGIVKDLQYLIEKAKDEFFADEEQMLRSEAFAPGQEAGKAKLEGIATKLKKIGEVNLAALGEYEKVNERYTFLLTQQEDLQKSIADLQETINKINRTTRSKFLKTFETLNELFKNIFTRLFKGGFAELILLDDDLLEAGIDIHVKPPGKKPQNINLLSGGEKAMTAISLLFAVFAIRPSPFCMLDEVDAALDETNVLRFKDMLMEMSEKTQFVLVTHNQKTMSFAETLYGITMEEKGVSKVVTVKFNK